MIYLNHKSFGYLVCVCCPIVQNVCLGGGGRTEGEAEKAEVAWRRASETTRGGGWRTSETRARKAAANQRGAGGVVLSGIAHLAPPVINIFSKFSGVFLLQESQRKQRDAEERVRVEKENAERRRREEQEEAAAAAEAARQQRQQQEEQQRRADQERQQAETVRKGCHNTEPSYVFKWEFSIQMRDAVHLAPIIRVTTIRLI